MRKLDGRKVRFLVTEDNRKYLDSPYEAVAPLDTLLNTYITGQHLDHNDPDTKSFLSLEEITGEVKITPAARAKRFKPLIDETTQIPIIHNKAYDCRVDENGDPLNTQDYWHAHFIIAQKYLVAQSKADIGPKHVFYLEDKEVDAQVYNSNADEVYEAEKLIREAASIGEYSDLVMLLNLYAKDFNVDAKKLSPDMLKQTLLKQAKTDPESIKFSFTQRGKDYLFISKIIEMNIIRRRKDGYYDGQEFIAADVERLADYVSNPEKDQRVSKWGRLLKEYTAEITA